MVTGPGMFQLSVLDDLAPSLPFTTLKCGCHKSRDYNHQ